MRRRSVLILTAVGLAAIGVGMAPWTLADDHAARQISKHVNALTGLGLEVRGPVTLAILPAPRIKFEDIVLSAADGTTRVTARQLRGQLQLAPLLSGRFVLADAVLVDPAARAAASRVSSESIWANVLAQLTAAYRRASGGAPPLSRLTVIGGTLTDAVGERPLAESVNATLAWPSPEAALSLSGNAVYKGQAVQFSLGGLAPRAIASGGDTDLTARLASEPLNIDLRGALTDGGRRFDGKTRLTTASLSRTNDWLDLRLPLTGSATALSIDATCSLSSRGMALTSAALTINDSFLEGALSLRGGANGWSLGGTLATDDLDLGAGPELARQLGATMMSPDRWRAWDIDLRLSAGRLQLPEKITARNVAASVLLRNGRLEAVLGIAEALDGRIKGRMTIAPASTSGVEIRAQGSGDGVSASQLSTLVAGAERITGNVSGAFTVETRGATASELRQKMDGRGHFQVGEGELAGVSLAGLAELKNAPTGLSDLRGKTKFSSLRVNWMLNGGRVIIDEALVQGSLANLRLTGSMDANGVLALDGSIPSGTGAEAAQFQITGPWKTPMISRMPTGPSKPGSASP
ncbi:hypothetical protein GCM10019059_17010 [Camelimonas fluminis]|uniref:AsmA-like C-terminal region-containing protein n=1 Tax=Camelimonas fluminis TaxID=1576911 RepID=A0ABV7UJQ4_9HYPH|nr:AsmA-like C-terminal region-containing protein [Camelimonas fluminis]GHE58232.1 hypothetical protein GCM10019059_17010 [Camelimonas fluminis]